MPGALPADGAGSAELVDLIRQCLDDNKAEDLVVIDLVGKTTIADAMVVASGRSARQVSAMADHLAERLKGKVPGPIGLEGQAQADWVLIDAGDVIVHLFRPEVRAFYRIEEMWGVSTPVTRADPRQLPRPPA
ncbi:MAG: ribosome silencing factor [Rhodospirillaceae bacterium]|nr:ribosome silencing factor [Rhodospirillaceae bacterium]